MSQADKVYKTLRESISMLADFAKHEDALHDALMGLYDAGVADGKAQMEGVLKSVISDVAIIVTMHVKKDAVGLKSALDDFVANRIILTGATVETRSIH